MAIVSLGGLLVLLARVDLGWPLLQILSFVALYPGLIATILLGASPHGGSFGDWRDFLIIPPVSGLFWGTALWALALLLRRFQTQSAA
jgi:hypothetical protein